VNILFINACVRKQSRTHVLAKDILSKMQGNITELDLAKENLARGYNLYGEIKQI
jgi:hypothetical protein